MDKVVSSAADAIAGIESGMSLAVGGFGLCGIPSVLIQALHDSGADQLEVISNNCGVDDWGLGILLRDKRIRRMVSSYVGENKEFERQYLSGELEVELTPQGTLAERMRAGGSGIPGFYTRTGVGTLVAEGKPTMDFDGETYILERGIVADLALVHAHTADTDGNLVYRLTARNFNPLAAMCGQVTFAQAEHIVALGDINPDHIVTPGVYIHAVAQAVTPTDIEQHTVRPRPVTEEALA